MVGPEKIQDFVNAYFEIGLRDYVPTPAKLYWIFHPAAAGAFIAHHVDKRWTYNVPITEPYEKFEDFTEEVLRERIKIGLGTDAYDIQIKSDLPLADDRPGCRCVPPGPRVSRRRLRASLSSDRVASA